MVNLASEYSGKKSSPKIWPGAGPQGPKKASIGNVGKNFFVHAYYFI